MIDHRATLSRVRETRDLYLRSGIIEVQFLLGLLNEVEASMSFLIEPDAAYPIQGSEPIGWRE